MNSAARIRLPSSRPSSAGFTLVELMIVVVIIGVLVAIAYPSYNRSIARSQRNNVKAVLMDLYTKQEAQKLKTGAHAADFNALGLTDRVFTYSTALYVNKGGISSSTQSAKSVYRVDLLTSSDATATAVCGPPASALVVIPLALRATAIGNQTTDSECRTLTICIAQRPGIKSATNAAGTTSADIRRSCWEGTRSS